MAMEGGERLLSFRNISKSFAARKSVGEMRAVVDVNLDIGRGEIVTLVGPSGCGKSTLLNMAAGLMAPSTGEVRYAGRPVTGIRGDVGYMTQNDHLLPWRTITRNIEIPLELRKVGRAERTRRARELIDLVGLTGFEECYPTQVSGGMRKRAALARVLAYNPETLLMDEPFGALDAQLRGRLQSQLVSLCRLLKKTVLFVTHDLDEAITIADRCVVFSPRPGTILRILDVDLPADRKLDQVRFDPRFLDLSKELWRLISQDQPAREPVAMIKMPEQA
jgi:NitT/TauT family transport system ATP-binding protein